MYNNFYNDQIDVLYEYIIFDKAESSSPHIKTFLLELVIK